MPRLEIFRFYEISINFNSIESEDARTPRLATLIRVGGVLAQTHEHTHIRIRIDIRVSHETTRKHTDRPTEKYTSTLHGWPTNLRFYSSSQLFGWLNCYKGTLLRSTVFARYILVHFVYGLWLTRLIRFAMFLLHGPTRGARIGETERSITGDKEGCDKGRSAAGVGVANENVPQKAGRGHRKMRSTVRRSALSNVFYGCPGRNIVFRRFVLSRRGDLRAEE